MPSPTIVPAASPKRPPASAPHAPPYAPPIAAPAAAPPTAPAARVWPGPAAQPERRRRIAAAGTTRTFIEGSEVRRGEPRGMLPDAHPQSFESAGGPDSCTSRSLAPSSPAGVPPATRSGAAPEGDPAVGNG